MLSKPSFVFKALVRRVFTSINKKLRKISYSKPVGSRLHKYGVSEVSTLKALVRKSINKMLCRISYSTRWFASSQE